jgi:hypothetical protein
MSTESARQWARAGRLTLSVTAGGQPAPPGPVATSARDPSHWQPAAFNVQIQVGQRPGDFCRCYGVTGAVIRVTVAAAARRARKIRNPTAWSVQN